MIAYSLKSIAELEVITKAEKWCGKKIISEEQLKKIKEKHDPNLFTPNIFIRVGLFFLTLILVNAAFGLLTTFYIFFDSNMEAMGFFSIFYGIIAVILLEFMISTKKTFKAGIDDALLYLAIGFLITGVCLITKSQSIEFDEELLTYAFIALPFFIIGTVRYLDNLLAILAFICLIIIAFLIVIDFGNTAKALLSFITMSIAASIYYLSGRLIKEDKFHFWKLNLKTIQVLSLLTFYLAANYFVVRELTIVLLDFPIIDGEDIPFSIFFHLTTLTIPFLYLYFGGKLKDRVIFVSGMVILAVTVATFKYYYSLGNMGFSLTSAGLIISAIAWYLIKYFKEVKFDITSEKESDLIDLNLEALVISYSVPDIQVPAATTDFGGGDFGGGGAGGKF